MMAVITHQVRGESKKNNSLDKIKNMLRWLIDTTQGYHWGT